jgi:outer membrane protein OmpA-like peptidoglycan-associated protein
MIKYFYLFIFCVVSYLGIAQSTEIDSLVDKKVYQKNIKIYKAILKQSPNKDVSIKLADALRIVGNYTESASEYAKIIDSPNISPICYKHYSQVLCKIGQEEECKQWKLRYKEYERRNDRVSDEAIDIDTSKYFLNRVPFNSPETDFGPSFYKNGLLFVSARSGDSKNTVHESTGESLYNFFYSEKRPDGSFVTPTQVFKTTNSTTYEGPMSLTADNSSIFLNKNNFSELRARSKDKKIMLQLVQGQIANDEITNISDFPYNDPNRTLTHPSISPDGKELYFAANIDSTIGGSDIFVSRLENGKWAKPENLGIEINSVDDEVYPFISIDGKLYFSSTGQGSIGGFDVFMSEKVNGKWTKAISLGLPFNTIFDDFSLIKNESEGDGYLASNRAGSLGSDDIFEFENAYKNKEEEKKFNPLLISLLNKDLFSNQKGNKIKGKLTPKSNNADLTGKVIQLLDKRKTLIKRSYVTQTGYFSFSNLKPGNYLVEFEDHKIDAITELTLVNKQNDFIDLEEIEKYKIGEVNKDSLTKDKNNFVVGQLITLNRNSPEEELVSLILVDTTGKIIRRVEAGKGNFFIFRNLSPKKYYVLTEDYDPNYTCNLLYHNPSKSKSILKADLYSYHYRHLASDSLRDRNLILHGQVQLDKPEGIDVLLLDENDNVIDRTKTNNEGYFVFRELNADNMHVMVVNDHPLLSFDHGTVYQKEDSIYHVTRKQIYSKLPFDENLLEQKVVVNGRITANGDPLNDKLILLIDKNNMVIGDAKTNEDGFFAFHHLNPDDYYIVVDEAQKEYILERNINIEDDEMRVSEDDFKKFDYKKESFDKDSFLSIIGSAYTKSNQQPISDKLVLLLNKDGKVVRQTVVGKNGNFTFVNLKPDNYMALFNNYDPDQKIRLKVIEEKRTKLKQTVNGKTETISVPISNSENTTHVFFDYNSSSLDSKLKAMIVAFCKNVIASGITEIELHGFTDMAGSDSFNVKLAEKRIQSCIELIEKTTPQLKYTQIPEGKSNRFKNTFGEYVPALNRRVEIKVK